MSAAVTLVMYSTVLHYLFVLARSPLDAVEQQISLVNMKQLVNFT